MNYNLLISSINEDNIKTFYRNNGNFFCNVPAEKMESYTQYMISVYCSKLSQLDTIINESRKNNIRVHAIQLEDYYGKPDISKLKMYCHEIPKDERYICLQDIYDKIRSSGKCVYFLQQGYYDYDAVGMVYDE